MTALALDLVINPNTIAKAFRELESEGVTVSRKGTGTFVAERRSTLSREERRRRLVEELSTCLTAALHRGSSEAEARKAFEEVVERLRFEREDAR